MGIKENITIVREKVNRACLNSGRDPSSVRLIAVSKTKPVADILEAVDAGQLIFGENYAQELRDKARELEVAPRTAHDARRTAIEWHFIGHLQKNKLKYILPVASWTHTIDSVELLETILRKAKDLILRNEGDPSPPEPAQDDRRVINSLIEVNIAGEDSKSGISPENVFELVNAFSKACKPANLLTCKLRGLMCMPPFSSDPETGRPYFKKLKDLLDEINSRNIYPEKLTELSMGTTQDFEVAIEEGATMVRIGSAIFGNRNT